MSALVFDLDGTLVSSRDDLVNALNVALTKAGYRAVDPALVQAVAGQGGRALIRRGLEENGVRWNEEMIDPLHRLFLDHYALHSADLTRPFDGATGALQSLRDAGWKLAVCTNKAIGLTLPLLQALDLTRLFDAVVGGDTFEHPKPHAAPVIGAVERAGGLLKGSIMIGDTATDVGAARAAGIPVIAVDFGYSETAVEELGADLVISHFDQLAAAVARLS